MCTVTFIPVKDNVYITSNRDVQHWRTSAVVPTIYPAATGNVLFPKDGDAGGTWIAAHDNGNAIVLLNGGFMNHTPAPPYRRSRGLILLDLIDSHNPVAAFRNISLDKIEPFTAVIWNTNGLFECRWDGEQKFLSRLSVHQPHIWSSATLYDKALTAKRKSWFNRWMQQHPQPSPDDILHFHQFTGDGDSYNDLRMNRAGQVFTASVTQLRLTDEATQMHYLDLKNDTFFTQQLNVEKILAGR